MEILIHNSTPTAKTPAVPLSSGLRLVQQRTSEMPAVLSMTLRRAELHRRLWHMLPGLLPLILAPVERLRPLPWEFLAMIAGLTLLLSGAALWCYRTIAREGETNWALNAMSFSAILLPPLFLFPAHPELACVVVAVLAIGDGAATLFGILFGGQTLPWNKSKTWVGFCSFFFGALPLAALTYWAVAEPSVPFGVAIFCVLPAVLIAQVSESLPVGGTDNFRVGAAAMVGVLVGHTAMLGWPS